MTDNLDIQATAPETDAPSAEIEVATDETTDADAEGAPEAPKADDDVPFPKKAVNALSRRDRQIGKLRAEQQQLQAELERYRAQAKPQEQSNSQRPSDYPDEDKFDNYGDFLKAVARYEARQEMAEGNKRQQQEYQQSQEQQWVAKRESEIADQAAEVASSIPDFGQTIAEYADVIDSFPPQLERLFLECENPPMAFYALAKEGRLEDLLQMTPYRAAMEIGRAQDRGIALSQRRPITKAPAPIAPARGLGTTGKSLSDMDPAELLKRWKL